MGSVASCKKLTVGGKGSEVLVQQVNPAGTVMETAATHHHHSSKRSKHLSLTRQARLSNGKAHSITTSLQGQSAVMSAGSLFLLAIILLLCRCGVCEW